MVLMVCSGGYRPDPFFREHPGKDAANPWTQLRSYKNGEGKRCKASSKKDGEDRSTDEGQQGENWRRTNGAGRGGEDGLKITGPDYYY